MSACRNMEVVEVRGRETWDECVRKDRDLLGLKEAGMGSEQRCWLGANI